MPVSCCTRSYQPKFDDVETSSPSPWAMNCSCWGARMGSVRSRTASTRLKIAVFAPIPSASVTRAAVVKPGVRRSDRAAYFTSRQRVSSIITPRCSFGSQRGTRFDTGGAACREEAGGGGNHRQNRGYRCVGDRIGGADVEQQPGDQPMRAKSGDDAANQSRSADPSALTKHKKEHVERRRADGHADADFARPARHGIREDAIQSDAGEREREQPEGGADVRQLDVALRVELELLVDRTNPVDVQARLGAAKRRLQRGNNGGGIACGADVN